MEIIHQLIDQAISGLVDGMDGLEADLSDSRSRKYFEELLFWRMDPSRMVDARMPPLPACTCCAGTSGLAARTGCSRAFDCTSGISRS